MQPDLFYFQETQYKHLGSRTLQTAWDLYKKTDWKLEKNRDCDRVLSRKDPKSGMIFRLEVSLHFLSKSFQRNNF